RRPEYRPKPAAPRPPSALLQHCGASFCVLPTHITRQSRARFLLRPLNPGRTPAGRTAAARAPPSTWQVGFETAIVPDLNAVSGPFSLNAKLPYPRSTCVEASIIEKD